MAQTTRYAFAYYCSGHGYGHATRVVALTHELLARGHRVYICTNAPEHVFQSATEAGASYRHAEIDAGIVQPKAYDVARHKTIEGLKRFLDLREERLAKEVSWLQEIQADAVLVDAPFLPCAAAHRAGIPSVIVSNFTFDSCYSYLSVRNHRGSASTTLATALQGVQINGNQASSDSLLAPPSTSSHSRPPTPLVDEEPQELPLEEDDIGPLVNQVVEDYSHASLLLRLPGCIPIPAFDTDVPMPSACWTNLAAHSFRDNIMQMLARDPATIPSCCQNDAESTLGRSRRRKTRKVVDVPLIARPVARDVYSTEKRQKMLSSLGVPETQHDPATTKVLVVSFGGQSIPRPSAATRPPTPLRRNSEAGSQPLPAQTNGKVASQEGAVVTTNDSTDKQEPSTVPSKPHQATVKIKQEAPRLQRLMTEDHIYLPGAPPALHRPGVMHTQRHRRKISIELAKELLSLNPAEESLDSSFNEHLQPVVTTLDEAEHGHEASPSQGEEDQLIPEGWIAIVCGIAGKEAAEDLPKNFYAAPRDVYVPDLTAMCDVLLGKLGYGTCSETVSTQTPFLYVPRPLFVEEFGLKRLMESKGTALPMTRVDFEAGNWAELITAAYEQGKEKRAKHVAEFEEHLDDESAASVIAKQVELFMAEGAEQ